MHAIHVKCFLVIDFECHGSECNQEPTIFDPNPISHQPPPFVHPTPRFLSLVPYEVQLLLMFLLPILTALLSAMIVLVCLKRCLPRSNSQSAQKENRGENLQRIRKRVFEGWRSANGSSGSPSARVTARPFSLTDEDLLPASSSASQQAFGDAVAVPVAFVPTSDREPLLSAQAQAQAAAQLIAQAQLNPATTMIPNPLLSAQQNELTLSSGSGSGLPFLMQRTVSRQIQLIECIGMTFGYKDFLPTIHFSDSHFATRFSSRE